MRRGDWVRGGHALARSWRRGTVTLVWVIGGYWVSWGELNGQRLNGEKVANTIGDSMRMIDELISFYDV